MKDFWYKFFIVALLVLNLYAVRWFMSTRLKETALLVRMRSIL